MTLILKVKPEEVNVSSPRLAVINQMIHHYIKQEAIPGAVALIARQGKIVHFGVYGKMDLEQDKPMREEAIFRIYSMTKPLTAVALLILYEQGYFQLNDPVSAYLPSFSHLKVLEKNQEVTPNREITIHDLFIHTAGFTQNPYESSLKESIDPLLNRQAGEHLKSFAQKMTELPLTFHPGSYWHYSSSYNILAYLVELFSGQSFDEWMAKKITTPLGMIDTAFYVPKHKKSRLAALYAQEKKEETDKIILKKIPENEEIFTLPTFLSGDFGLFSTATDYLRFCQMLLNRGELDGNRILSRKTVELMTSQHLQGALSQVSKDVRLSMGLSGIGYGLGIGIMLDPARAQVLGSVGDFFWSGLANTSFFVDPQENLIALLFTQVATPTKKYSLQRDFRVAVYQAII